MLTKKILFFTKIGVLYCFIGQFDFDKRKHFMVYEET